VRWSSVLVVRDVGEDHGIAKKNVDAHLEANVNGDKSFIDLNFLGAYDIYGQLGQNGKEIIIRFGFAVYKVLA